MGKRRNNYIDIVKGVAIILVVIGHCFQFGTGNTNFETGAFFSNPVFKFIYSFHMPLFMLVSGYLFHYSINRSTHDIIKGKLTGIILPLISWHTLYQLICICKGDTISLNIFFLSYFHTLWFLRALFYSCIIVLIVNRIFKDSPLAYIFVFAAMLFIPDNRLPSIFVFTMPFFCLGYLFNKSNAIRLFDKTSLTCKRLTFTIISLVYFLLLLYFKDNYYAYVTKSCLINSDNTIFYTLFVDAYRFLTALSGCIFILVLLWKLHQMVNGHAIAKTIMFFSKISLCIYIVNHYTNETVLLNLPIETLNYSYIAIETVCVLMLSYLFYYAFNSTKLTRFMFLGGRGK